MLEETKTPRNAVLGFFYAISSPPLCWRCDSKYIISYPYTHSNINIVKNKKKYFKQKKKRKNACHFQFL